MVLSVVIPFCDKDFQFLERAVSSIKRHVKFNDYEIITVDNREKEKRQVAISGVKVISKGYNLDCFDARRFGAQHSQGDFIWNFDADDLMVGDLYRKDIKDGADAIQMFYAYNNGVKFNRRMLPVAYGANVWSRLYRADIVKDFYAKLEKPVKVFLMEDKLLFDAVCKAARLWWYVPRIVYEYNYKGATFSARNKDNNMAMFQNRIKDAYNGYKYVYSVLGDPLKVDKIFEQAKRVAEQGY